MRSAAATRRARCRTDCQIAFALPSTSMNRLDGSAARAPSFELSVSMSVSEYFTSPEMLDQSHQKFWTVKRSGASLTTEWGRIGSKGQSQKKSFATPAAATKAEQSQVAEKVSKGYAPVQSGHDAKVWKQIVDDFRALAKDRRCRVRTERARRAVVRQPARRGAVSVQGRFELGSVPLTRRSWRRQVRETNCDVLAPRGSSGTARTQDG